MQERAAFGLGPRPAGTPACGDPGHTAALAPLARRRVSQGPGVRPSVQGGVEAWTRQQVLASGAQHPHRQTDRQCPGPGWSLRQRLRQQKPQKPDAQRKGSVDSPGPEASPRPRRPRALGTPEGMEGSGSKSCKTLGGPRAGEAPVPRGGPRAHGSVRALSGIPLQARGSQPQPWGPPRGHVMPARPRPP